MDVGVAVGEDIAVGAAFETGVGSGVGVDVAFGANT